MRLLDHLRAGRELASLDQDVWQRGFSEVPGWTHRKPVLVPLASTIAGCGFGAVLGSTWWERVFFAVVIAAGAFSLGLVGLWLWQVASASKKQRDEARSYALALEEHARAYAEWARSREIVDDFYIETWAHWWNITQGLDPNPDDQLEAYWRAHARDLVPRLREHHVSDALIVAIMAPLRALEDRDDDYGDRNRDRVRNNMLTIAQNLRGASKQEPPPQKPDPPGLAG